MSCTSLGIMRVKGNKTPKAKPLESTDKRMDPRKNRRKATRGTLEDNFDNVDWSGQA